MRGSLARLVLRAQGQLPVAEPLLPSRFEPPGPAPVTTDPLATEAGWSEPPGEPSPAPRAHGTPFAARTREPEMPPAPEAQRAVASKDATRAEWREPVAAPAPTPPTRGMRPASRVGHIPRSSTGAEAPPTAEAQRAPASQDAMEAEAEWPVSMSSLSRGDMAPRPVHTPLLPPATPFAIQALAAGSPEWAQALPSAVPAHPVTAAARLAQAEKPELTARISTSRLRPTAPGETFEAESLQPVAAAFAAPPTEIPRSARTPPPYGAGLPPPAARVPDVQISIGRVEVHAAPARAAPVRAAPARRPPLSLADYLAQRK